MRTINAVSLLILFCFSNSAAAQDPTPPPSGPGTAAALSAGTGNNCAARYYPMTAIKNNEQGDTTINVTISAEGVPTKVEVTQSSGSQALDNAAADCVMKGWHFKPATVNGQPVVGTKNYKIVWRLGDGVNPPMISATSCRRLFSAEITAFAGKSAIVQFHVDPDGGVSKTFVAISSGDEDFDKAAAKCASDLIYAHSDSGGSWGGEVVASQTALIFNDGVGVWNRCRDDMFPANSVVQKDAVVSFHVVAGGEVAKATIEQSSGNHEVDRAALSCIQLWHHRDRLFIGQNLDAKMSARIAVRDGHAYALETLAQ